MAGVGGGWGISNKMRGFSEVEDLFGELAKGVGLSLGELYLWYIKIGKILK